jgi:C4-dicarboxylate-specific signal transduction histidine kinase
MQSAAMAETLGAPLQLGEAHEAWGRCLLERGSADEATRHLAQARELFERAGAVPFVDRVNRVLRTCQAKLIET